MDDDEWMKTYQANVMAHLWLMQALEDELKANKGCFIVSASVAGLRTTGSSMAYCECSRTGVHPKGEVQKALTPQPCPRPV